MDLAGCYRPSYNTDTYVNVLPYGMSRQSLAMGNAKRIQVLRHADSLSKWVRVSRVCREDCSGR